MATMWMIMLSGLILGIVGVASNPSPYFAALGLVVAAVMGCGIVVGHGGSFLSLVFLLIYLGGMLVVFAYCAALAAEPYPEGWVSGPLVNLIMSYVLVVGGVFFIWADSTWVWGVWLTGEEVAEMMVVRGDVGGVALLYSLVGGGTLVIGGWALLLSLFVVLELTRGLSRGALRAV
uniref:NADH-ubiquinone oxidoreductase chain 6 n=1 Tax=Moolgarda cunnesius TaxID=1111463 RepID=I1T2I6_MOOCU|nr:NADH dehydrogenase subunit 6 [Moolgarda cunnesius]AEK53208.2 NADH dehydrogenase subunit 6 [Moolgarda cunnesius]